MMKPSSLFRQTVLLACLSSVGCSELRSAPPDSPASTRAGSGGRQGNPDSNSRSGGANGGAGSNGGDAAGAGACTVGATRCAATAADVEICTIAGQWQVDKACPSLCENGACAGKCTPDEKQCGAAQTPEKCGPEGDWAAAGMPCPFVCSGKGECTGECKPGDKKCGDAPNNLAAFECDDKGKWVMKTLCQNLCADGSCGGSCMPDKVHCVGNKPETCSAQGTWTPGQVCKDQTCVDGICAGMCEPTGKQCGNSNNPRTCDPKGKWIDQPACAGKTCVNGVCVGACAPDAAPRCSADGKAIQTCGAGGVWMNSTPCPNGCKDAQCLACDPNKPPTCEGTSLKQCVGGGTSMSTSPCVGGCAAGACCTGQTEAMGGSCGSCGGQNQPCCKLIGPECNGNLACQSNKCVVPCANNMGQNCIFGNPCLTGTYNCAGECKTKNVDNVKCGTGAECTQGMPKAADYCKDGTCHTGAFLDNCNVGGRTCSGNKCICTGDKSAERNGICGLPDHTVCAGRPNDCLPGSSCSSVGFCPGDGAKCYSGDPSTPCTVMCPMPGSSSPYCFCHFDKSAPYECQKD